MASFLWYQTTEENRAWREALSDQRQKVLTEIKPAYITVLDALAVPDEENWSREDYDRMKYIGPWYGDWDAEDISDSIKGLHQFLAHLKERVVALDSIRLYATGGRGFHCEIPEEIFNPKPSRAGVTLLPWVYREMAMELITDCMDMRVYSARKGRMWRCVNYKRSNGRYKVSITAEEALNMTPELYEELTASPRNAAYIEAPKANVQMSSMFTKAKEKVEGLVKARVKHKGDLELLERFKGEFPPTVNSLMAGKGIAPGKGFHNIAMQLAITAVALGKSRDQFVEACDGLVQSHQGDSQRYNSPRKRKEELRRAFDYHSDGLYSYSRGGIRGLCEAGMNTADLDSPIESAGVGMVEDEHSDLPEDLIADIEMSSTALLEGVLILKKGIFRRTSEGAKPISNLAMLNPTRLVDLEDGLQVGLEVDIFCDDKPRGRELVPMQTFRSRAAFNDFCTGRAAMFSGQDTNASAVQVSLSRKAAAKNDTTYIVRKEGLDIVVDPTVKNEIRYHIIWVSSEAVLGKTDNVMYRFQPKVASGPVFKADLINAQRLEDTPEARTWLRSMLSMNNPTVMAQMLGWFVSCFHKQFYQIAYNQFPLLHPNGTAGSGKTLTTQLMAKMFYTTNPVVMMGASHAASTNFSLKSAWTGSASIPIIIDEYKPSELAQGRGDFLLQHFRMLYNQASGASGGINRGAAESSFRDVTQYTYSAPTVYLGESQEMQTAIVQRSIPVGFQEQESKQYTASFLVASDIKNQHYFSRLGKELLLRSLAETVESRQAALDPIRAMLRKEMDYTAHDRQVYNTAVVICGLVFLGDCLNSIFGDEFDAAINALCGHLITHKDDLNTFAMPESHKVLNDMAMISRTEPETSEFALREGYEYVYGDGFMDIQVKESFVKYFAWCNRKGFKPLYTSADGFINSLAKSAVTVDRACFNSALREKGSTLKIYRLSTDKLSDGGIEPFKVKALT